ncbi:uncharacterized protein TM35_000332380 [Trypanosoma theileri]|uniref:Uncharacterized protein n=1 Tax=Trypanosoma theileri TaxID=67003 RepID=A0A1X0NMH7_9TRYP|nr:uncharacterized protein TM35_000332380 [Trypanosoma theileri]ORC85781.1 hypothetical protein TM35_000332380 [Trypanosoma theileri]
MFIQLRRVVYLLVLLHYCVCLCVAQTNIDCSGEEKELGDAKRVMDTALKGPVDPEFKSSDTVLKEGKDLLSLWKREAEACEKKNIAIIYAVGNTTAIRYGVETDTRKQVAGVKKLKCNGEEVQEFKKGYAQMMSDYNDAMAKTENLTADVKTTRLQSRVYYENLLDVHKRYKDGLDWYNSTILEMKKKGCSADEGRMKVLADAGAKYDEIETVRKGLADLQVKSTVCALNTTVFTNIDMNAMFDEIKKLCPDDLDVKRVNATSKPEEIKVTERVKVEENVGSRVGRKQITETARKNFSYRMVAERPRRIEAERKAAGEERARKEAAERAEEARKAEEERRRIEEENARRAMEEEEARKKKDEEEKARQAAAQKAREEETKRIAAEKAKQAAKRVKEEEARQAAEKAKKKKDGSNGPSLVRRSILLLLLLTVLGSALVC